MKTAAVLRGKRRCWGSRKSQESPGYCSRGDQDHRAIRAYLVDTFPSPAGATGRGEEVQSTELCGT